MTRVAINGMGRIGRTTLRILDQVEALDLVAINDPMPLKNLIYLLRYDTVYGRMDKSINADADNLLINDSLVQVSHETEPQKLPWDKLDIDIVFECSGVFKTATDLETHLSAGAKRVILSAPAKGGNVSTVVYGATGLKSDNSTVVSTSSCTTNCVAPVAEIMDRRIGVKKAALSTIHAYTSSQGIVDTPADKMERGRAGAASLIPTSTGAADSVGELLPAYHQRFDGIAIRVPVAIGSIADLTFVTSRATSVEEVNAAFREEAETQRYKSVLGVSEEPLVSTDFVADSRASIVALAQTRVIDDDLVKVLSWYDNEWGYASQMVRQAIKMSQ